MNNHIDSFSLPKALINLSEGKFSTLPPVSHTYAKPFVLPFGGDISEKQYVLPCFRGAFFIQQEKYDEYVKTQKTAEQFHAYNQFLLGQNKEKIPYKKGMFSESAAARKIKKQECLAQAGQNVLPFDFMQSVSDDEYRRVIKPSGWKAWELEQLSFKKSVPYIVRIKAKHKSKYSERSQERDTLVKEIEEWLYGNTHGRYFIDHLCQRRTSIINISIVFQLKRDYNGIGKEIEALLNLRYK